MIAAIRAVRSAAATLDEAVRFPLEAARTFASNDGADGGGSTASGRSRAGPDVEDEGDANLPSQGRGVKSAAMSHSLLWTPGRLQSGSAGNRGDGPGIYPFDFRAMLRH